MTLCSMEGSFVSEEHHCFHLQGRGESSWETWWVYGRGGGKMGHVWQQ